MEYSKIYLESCMDTMCRIGDKEIDLIVTSPPYNLLGKVTKGKVVKRSEGSANGIAKKYEDFEDFMKPDDYFKFHSTAIREMLRISKQVAYNIMITTGNKSSLFKIIGQFAEDIKDIIVWSKPNPQPAIGVGVLNRGSELIIMFDSVSPVGRKFSNFNFERGTVNDVWTDIKNNKQYTGTHSAGMPIDLAVKLIDRFSKPGELVYDPFMGTDTTAIASIITGRNWVGSEISESYHSLSLERIENFKKENGI